MSFINDVRDLIEDHRADGIAPVEEVTDVIVLYRAKQKILGGDGLREMNGSMKSGMASGRGEELLRWALDNAAWEKTCCCGKERGHE